MHETEAPQKTAVIGALQLPNVSDAEHQSHIAELGRLLKTLGYEVVGVVSQKRQRPDIGAVFGSGKLKEIAAYTGGTGVVPSAAPRAKSNEPTAPTDVPMGEGPRRIVETPMGTSSVSLGPAPASAEASGASSGAPTASAAALRGPSLPLLPDDASEPDGPESPDPDAPPTPYSEADEATSEDLDAAGPGDPGPDPGDASADDLDDPIGAPIAPGLIEVPHADVLVVDHEITPRQARNLERATDAEVMDRTGVIVDIFHRHAQTREARLQVEIARLTYVVPRLRAGVRGGDRQRGGIGGKGAGESSLELDRRKVRDRIAQLKAELEDIQREDRTRRQRRQGLRRVALVGYTNAGKSSLMRALTGSEVLVEDKLFATLGTTVRALQPEVEPRVLVSDTVGFIRRLPHDLVASFRSTLEEAREASLLLYVVDASDPDFRAQLAVTREVLSELGATTIASRLVLNKIDKVTPPIRAALTREFPDAIQLSAHDKRDVSRLRELIIEHFEGRFEEAELFVPYAFGKLAAELRASFKVLAERHDEHGTTFTVSAPAAAIARMRTRVEAN